VSRLVPESAAALLGEGQDASPTAAGLLPGLYDASPEHLVHALSSGGNKWFPPPRKFTKIKLRQDALETTFSVVLNILYPPNFDCLAGRWTSSTATRYYVDHGQAVHRYILGLQSKSE